MKKKIKIGFINYSLDIGGVETLILEIGKRLNRDIFEPSIFVFEKNGKLRKEYINYGIPVIEVEKSKGFDWILPFRLSRILKKHNINIVHTHNPSNWFYGCIAANIAGIPIVHTEHSNHYGLHIKRWELIESILSKFTDSITTVAENLKRRMVTRSHINSLDIRVIHNAIDLAVFNVKIDKYKVKSDLSLPENNMIIGNIARFCEQKDHRTLLKAFKLISENMRNINLLLVGNGPLKAEMEDIVRDLQIRDKVKFLGDRRDIPNLLKIIDIFVLSSKREGLPVVLLEAMASGLPIVATSAGGNSEVVIDGETGVIVPTQDPERLAEAICKVISDEKRAKEMGERGQKRIKECFTFEHMIDEYEKIYNSVGRRRRICVVGEFPPPPGGMGVQADLLVDRLKEEGFSVSIIRRNTHFRGLLVWVNKVKVLRSIFRFMLYIGNIIMKVLSTDVIHIFSNCYKDFFLYTYPAVIWSRIFGKRVIIHYHGGSAYEFFKRYISIIKPAMEMAHRIVVPSEFLMDIFKKYRIKATIIPNICNLHDFGFRQRGKFSPNFIITRHLDRKYNVECAVKAFNLVKEKYPAARLNILGGGPEEARLKKMVDRLGLSGSVSFLGRVDNNRMPQFYRDADIFLNSSNVDNMPISVLEAFACGLPVVSTNAGGLKYLIEDRKTGFLVNVNDYTGMAQKIFELLEHQDRAKEIAFNARKFADTFSWNNIKAKWSEVYAG